MKFVVLLFLGITLIAGFVSGQGFYDPDSIHTIELTFTQPNWDYILDTLYDRGLKQRLLGTAVIDGVVFDSVGVRYKGNSTYSPSRVKNPLNIKLDYVIDGQEIQGYGTLKLANSWSDPSFIREVLGYEIARKYMPAALCNYANVYVNGSLIGLYVSVQDYDKLFLRSHFSTDENPFFEGTYEGIPPGNLTVLGYLGEDSSLYSPYYEMESDTGWSDLIDFLDTLNDHPVAVDSVLNIDRHLWMLAFDFLMVNLDAPINMYHNYYLYREQSGQFHPILWDLNMNFGGFRRLVSGGNLGLNAMHQLDPYTHLTNFRYPLINKLLTTDTLKRKYIAHMKTMMTENFSNGWYQIRGAELQSIIADDVQADPYKFYSFTNFQANLTSTVLEVVGIEQLMTGRVAYLSSRDDFLATPPNITAIAHAPAIPMAHTPVVVTAHVSGATSVELNYKTNPVDPFAAIPMYDDGAHSDGQADDGFWGATIHAGITSVHYYIYAENDDAGIFEPARAEFEDSVISVKFPSATDLVINEFMADNTTSVADQNGEYEDWIEIHNPTSSSVSLQYCHLSDKIATPGKWTFPDTSINAGGYITIWADQDTTQIGLHANFALSKSGEAVVLSDSSLAIIDTITFGAQVTDSSYGRCPDGAGGFGFMAETFGAVNNCANCCKGLTGNIDCDPGNGIDIADLSRLIDYLFISLSPLCCDASANSDGDLAGRVDIADLTALIDFLYISLTPPATCK